MNDFYLWQTLSQTAVVGTGKAALPPPLLGFFAAKGMDVHTSPEETLLAAAALVQLRIRAGRQFPRWEGPVPEAVSMGPGAINDRAGRSLAAILSGRFAPALGEWLELFAASGLSLPP